MGLRSGRFRPPGPFGKAPTLHPWELGPTVHTAAPNTPPHLGSPHSAAILGVGVGAMSEDGLSKAERYREAANRYGELAKSRGGLSQDRCAVRLHSGRLAEMGGASWGDGLNRDDGRR
jgi:hypothetical protein